MFRRQQQEDALSQPVPISELVGRAFRSAALIPFLILALLFAIGVPLATVDDQAAQGEDFAAVLQGVISDRTALFLGKAESVARLIGSGSDEVTTEERLDQLVKLDPAIESALVADSLGSLVIAVGEDVEGGAAVHAEAAAAVRESRERYVSSPGFDEHLGARAIVMAVPVFTPTEELVGTLQMHVNTEWIHAAIVRTNATLEVNTFVTDNLGNLVVHEEEWRVLAGQELETVGSGLVSGFEGQRIIAGVVDVPEWGGEMKVFTTWPLSVVYVNVLLGMVPVLIVLVAYVITVRARRQLIKSVVDPIEDLEATIESYGPANLDVRVGPTGVEEFDGVGVMFNATANRIDSLIESLRESNAQLEDFASIAAHDLQEPLRKVRAFGDMLARSSGDDLGEDGRRYLERMQDAAGRMQQLIDDLLVYSRLTTRAAPSEPVDLNETVARVIDDLDLALGDAGTTVEVDRLPSVNAEPTQMYQLFQNLISNAIKFRREDEPHRIDIGSERGDDGNAVITIADNGIGFSNDYSEQIFKIFERLHGRTSYAGTGIGLALCRKIVERHGGSITASGAEGAGATFTITIPANDRELIDAR